MLPRGKAIQPPGRPSLSTIRLCIEVDAVGGVGAAGQRGPDECRPNLLQPALHLASRSGGEPGRCRRRLPLRLRVQPHRVHWHSRCRPTRRRQLDQLPPTLSPLAGGSDAAEAGPAVSVTLPCFPALLEAVVSAEKAHHHCADGSNPRNNLHHPRHDSGNPDRPSEQLQGQCLLTGSSDPPLSFRVWLMSRIISWRISMLSVRPTLSPLAGGSALEVGERSGLIIGPSGTDYTVISSNPD